MTIEIISLSISRKALDWTRIELATPGSAVRHASVDRRVTDCATRPGTSTLTNSDDPDEMQHNAAFHQGLHCFLRLKKSSYNRIQNCFVNYNLSPLDMYNRLSKFIV